MSYSCRWEEFIDSDDDDGVRGAHGPYRVIGTSGSVYEIHAWHVVRDHNSSYPIGMEEWADMSESGKHASFHAAALFSKASRQLLAKTIVVLRKHDGVYLWCVRIHYVLEGMPRAGRTFLWPLSWQKSNLFHDELCLNPAMATSSLVVSFEPPTYDLFPWDLAGVRPVKELASCWNRAFVSQLNVVSHSQEVGISRRWMDPGNLRGLWMKPLQLGGPSRRSPRLVCASLTEVLSQDLVAEVVGHGLQHKYMSSTVSNLHEVLQTRLVCKGFNVAVCEGMARAAKRTLDRVDRMMQCADINYAYIVRATVCSHGLDVYRAMAELGSVQCSNASPSVHDLVRVYMRLLFNKGLGACPPRPPVKGLRPPWERMHAVTRVLGETPLVIHVHGTRHTQQRRVRFRMKVPGRDLPNQITKGWKYVPEPRTHERCMCPLHSGALAA